LFGKPSSTFPDHALITPRQDGSGILSDTSTLDHFVNIKAAKDGFVRTRWWWIRHAPVIVDEGRIYGQIDLPCDCSDARVFASLARLLPRKAVWLTSHLA